MSTLYWLNNDLRLGDNPALTAAAADDSLTCVFCIDPHWFRTDRFGNRRMGTHRWRFLRESLLDLHQQLSQFGQTLHLLEGNPGETLPTLLATGQFNRIVRTRQHTSDAVNIWDALQTAYPAISFEQYDSATLYGADAITRWSSLPETFSAFKRALAGTPFRPEVAMPSRLPGPASIDIDDRLIESPASSAIVRGGATAAHRHLGDYFDSGAASAYRETRNNLAGRHYATGTSPWLGNGCLSPVEVLQRLRRYEAERGANESTEWILFELLWREFFQWYGYAYGDRLFQFSGINGRRPLTTFYRERFLKWREGRTPWPIVNACMAELKETGLLSNRGRQLAG
ncbi:MAG: deoxyribodipyrimidine photo-lyase [Proteobacteria bacterium]|nr:deoxyribodipyrimidine photo-lyase [Pseudomonadota bacterium]